MGTIPKKRPGPGSAKSRTSSQWSNLPAIVPWNSAAADFPALTQFVTVSPKFQVVIPQAIRESLQLKPGDRLCLMLDGDELRVLVDTDDLGYGSIPQGEPFIRDEDDRV